MTRVATIYAMGTSADLLADGSWRGESKALVRYLGARFSPLSHPATAHAGAVERAREAARALGGSVKVYQSKAQIEGVVN